MTSNAFLTSIERRFHSMSRYEDQRLQSKARSLIPVILLELRAQERMRLLQKQIKKGEIEDENITTQELLLLELMSWFKTDFFDWVDNPDCDYCYSETKFSHMSNDPAILIHTDRVEMHRCLTCEKFTSFPRYENLEILLETREGRCGEWANVFTLLCRTMGWDARLIFDQTDHVWTEVFSIAQQRWLHCDPCENICDNPLIYETGWNKKLSYIIAYSYNEVQDVTWRYSADHKSLLQNRTICGEGDLITTLLRLRNYRQSQFSPAKRKYLTRRLLVELAELMEEKKPNEADKQGRTSGSLAWRLQRGETNIDECKIWSPTDDDLSVGQMIIRYSPIKDQYERIRRRNIVEVVQKWQSGVFKSENLFRKVETDWKVVYLCRQETASKGEIQWRFDSGKTGKIIDKIKIHFDSKIFENGQMTLLIHGNNKTIDISSNTASTLEITDLSGSTLITVVAVLSGGVGNCAWQHVQLFRQPLDANDFPFVINIKFK